MARPFVTLCIFLFVGIFLGYKLVDVVTPWVLGGIILCLLTLLVILAGKVYEVALLWGTLILLGIWLYQGHINQGTKLGVFASDGHNLLAVVESRGIKRPYFMEYDVLITDLIQGTEGRKIREKAKLQVMGQGAVSLYEPGQRIDIKEAHLLSSLEKKALGEYEFYLRTKGFKSIIRAKAENIRDIEENPWRLRRTSYRSKKYIEDYFDEGLSPRKGNLLKSILFGNQGYMTREDMEVFSKSGTAHIVAVSGLHVGVLVLLIQSLLEILGIGRNGRLISTALVLLLYSYIVNFPLSILRAGSMYYLYILAYFLNRRYDSINSLLFIAWVIGIYNPLSVFTVSFQLSFVATLSILLLYPVLQRQFKGVPKYLGQLLAVTLAAQLGTAPILAYHFGEVSLISLVANVLIVPMLGGVLALALGSAFVGLFSTFLAGGTLTILEGLLGYMYGVVEKSSQLPFASVEITALNWHHILLYYGGIGLLFLYNRKVELSHYIKRREWRG